MATLLDMAQNPGSASSIPMMVQGAQTPDFLDTATKLTTLRSMNIQNKLQQNELSQIGVKNQILQNQAAMGSAQLGLMPGQKALQQNELTKSNYDVNDLTATRNAMAGNIVQDPETGQLGVNMRGALSDLVQTNPTAALNLSMTLQAKQTELAEKKAVLEQTTLGNAMSKNSAIASVALGATDQTTYDAGLAALKSAGIDVSSAPKEYNADNVSAVVNGAVKADQQISLKLTNNRQIFENSKTMADINAQSLNFAAKVTKDYVEQDSTKKYTDISAIYGNYKAMASTPDFNKGDKDLNLVYALQNVMNPGKSATEGTVELDTNTRDFLGRIQVPVEAMLNGAKLDPRQRQQITAFIESKYAHATAQQKLVAAQYENQAIQAHALGMNIDPSLVIPTIGDVSSPLATLRKAGQPAAESAPAVRLPAPMVPGQRSALPTPIDGITAEQLATDPTILRANNEKPTAKNAGIAIDGTRAEATRSEVEKDVKAESTFPMSKVQAYAAQKGMTVDQVVRQLNARGFQVGDK